ncbi:T9SS type A sorting domain-containing protein [Olleya sp. HaHaR_3_96]|uniref:T9SS type A sorting domain-containing protein n=1 Tax=Olleya sp. HaHaR_3_96 TaxID=2745560 RepID=UPI001C4EFEDA|nr:T9SS type A sorting domain-containing protein [Olleya sp. HaHaR_3_96]QXP58790.1 T9SS type A sorting domain-containing protein [Olleya sp. HaHaR_3_96]
MKQKLYYSKKIKNAILVIFLNLSCSAFAQNTIGIDYPTNINAVNELVYGTSNGVDTYKTFEITIPFYSSSLNELKLRTDIVSYTCNGSTMINVDGVNSTYSGNSIATLHKWFVIQNIAVGQTYYTIKSLCNGAEIPGSRKLIRIVVIKEATPTIDLTMGGYCVKDANGSYTGNIHLTAVGSYTNAGKLYLQTTTSANNCNPNSLIKLTNMATSNAPNNTINNNGFYSCNVIGTYNVKMFYQGTSLSGELITQQITNGDLGWIDYSFTKSFGSCLNRAIPVPLVKYRLQLETLSADSPIGFSNPVKDELKLFLNSSDNISFDIEIHNLSGTIVKKSSFKDVNNKSNMNINIENLKKGIYIVSIKKGNSIIRKKMSKD